MQSIESRRRAVRRYVRDIWRIQGTYKLDWKRAHEAYRRARASLNWRRRGDVNRNQIAATAAPVEEGKFSITFWFILNDTWVEDLASNRTISFNFEGFGGPKGTVQTMADGALIIHKTRRAGDGFFEDKYAESASRSPQDWAYYWRIMEPIGVLLTKTTARYFWLENYNQWQKK